MLSDDEFRILLDHLDRPWSGFRKVRKGVKKRLRRHMHALKCSTIQQYVRELHRQPDAMAVCQERLRVTISRFFRDRQLWRALQTEIVPGLVKQFSAPIRIWSAGCACGEEPYSMAVVWSASALCEKMDLLATDADDACLNRARIGRYPASSLKEVPHGLREEYFQQAKGGRQMQIRHERLPPIRWQRHDLLETPPEAAFFHLILLRNNLLTYYRGAVLQDAFARIMARLHPGGYLVVGAHEHLPTGQDAFARQASCPWVYQRRK